MPYCVKVITVVKLIVLKIVSVHFENIHFLSFFKNLKYYDYWYLFLNLIMPYHTQQLTLTPNK